MVEIILFRPKEIYSQTISCFQPPLGLLHIASALQSKGFTVRLIDTGTTDNWQSALEAEISNETILVGISVMTGWQVKGGLEFSRAVKKISDIPIVWGGVHPSLLPEQTILHDLVNIVVIGEGEQTLVSVVECIQSRKSLQGVPNIIYKTKEDIVQTPRVNTFLDMNSLQLPDYSIINT